MSDSQEEQRKPMVEENRRLQGIARTESAKGNKNPFGLPQKLLDEIEGLRDRARAEMGEGNKNPFGLPQKLLDEIEGLRDRARDEQGITASFSDKPPSKPSTPNNSDKGQKPNIGL